MIPTREVERRVHRVSELRRLILGHKRSAISAFEEGRIPFKPVLDIRSDTEYWRRIAKEKGHMLEDKTKSS